MIIKWDKMASNGARGYDNCYGCAFLPQINGRGDFYNCGHFYGKEEFMYGNIVEQSFKDIINGDKYQRILTKVETEVDVHQCGRNCRQNEINEFLWKFKHPPEHVNFI